MGHPVLSLGTDRALNIRSDEIYEESWKDALKACERGLERHDHDRALQVKSKVDFVKELDNLLREYPDERPKKAIRMIQPTLDHFETFARDFVKMMTNPVDTSLMWGLLFLVFKLALGSTGPGPLERITSWLEEIGYKISTLNDCRESISDFEKVKKDTLHVNTVLVTLWLDIIMTFRRHHHGHTIRDAWSELTEIYKQAYKNIEDATRRIESVARLAEKQAIMLQNSVLQRLMVKERSHSDGVTLPCHTLPVAENRRFFGREEILKDLEDHLKPEDRNAYLSSIALYGLGGIGKTQTALAYAYSKLNNLDAIFWIPAEDALSINQGFSRAATDALKLPGAQPHAHQENMFRVLNWLQNTEATWLLVFDNVDSHEVLDGCWPVTQHGAVLVTTRDILVATLPIDRGVEIPEFDKKRGAEFLLLMTPRRKKAHNEAEFAEQVSEELGGLPLALNQMAALINARSLSIEAFCSMYAKHKQQLHQQKKSGFKYIGYGHGLDTVWELSFESLEADARTSLGVLSFMSADAVPMEVFTKVAPESLHQSLLFCQDELSFGDAIEQLTRHGLLRNNITEGTFRIHRLVQSEYRQRMQGKQEAFEAAVKLLLSRFPTKCSNAPAAEDWLLYDQYLPQVLAVARNYNDSQKEADPLRVTIDFVHLLVNSFYAIHDNDTTGVSVILLDTADKAYKRLPEEHKDKLLWALLQSYKSIYHMRTSEFERAEKEMREVLQIRLELLPSDDLFISLAYSALSMAIASQNRYEEGLDLILKAGVILDGPAGVVPGRKVIWNFNTARNYYCIGDYDRADAHLRAALEDAERRDSWYLLAHGHLAIASLWTRALDLEAASTHSIKAKQTLETSGIAARFSWVSSYCAYRAGDIAGKQGHYEAAIAEHEEAVAIGKLTKVPPGVLARCTHALSEALKRVPSRAEEAEHQRIEARRLRAQLPGGGGDLDDESDAAFERLVKIDHR